MRWTGMGVSGLSKLLTEAFSDALVALFKRPA